MTKVIDVVPHQIVKVNGQDRIVSSVHKGGVYVDIPFEGEKYISYNDLLQENPDIVVEDSEDEDEDLDNPPTRLSLSAHHVTMSARLPWDADLDTIMEAFIGCLEGLTYPSPIRYIRDWCNDQLRED